MLANSRNNIILFGSNIWVPFVDSMGASAAKKPATNKASLRIAAAVYGDVDQAGAISGDGAASSSLGGLQLHQSLNDYFFSKTGGSRISRTSKWYSMEELITHFLYYSEGPSIPGGFSTGGVEAPKGHLGVTVVSTGGTKVSRARIRSSIQIMASQLNNVVQGSSLGDFVVIVSGSNIVIGEVDR
jgi:hypothetical protein